jgi:hypothetical protein
MTTPKKQTVKKDNAFGNVQIKRKRKSDITIRKELFISIINNIEAALNRQELLFADFRLDWTTYNELFFNIIDDLIFLEFGNTGLELIDFYLYGKENTDGSENQLIDKDNNVVPLNSAEDLWNLIKTINA